MLEPPYGHDYVSFLKRDEPWRYDFAEERNKFCLTFENCRDKTKSLYEAYEEWYKHGGLDHEEDPLAIAFLSRLTQVTNRHRQDKKLSRVCLGFRDIMNTYVESKPIMDGIEEYITLAHSIGNFTAIPKTYLKNEPAAGSVLVQQSKGGIKSDCVFGDGCLRKDSEFAFLRNIQSGAKKFEGFGFDDYVEVACLETYCADDSAVEEFNSKCKKNKSLNVVSEYKKAFPRNPEGVYAEVKNPTNWFHSAAIRIEARGRYITALLKNDLN